MLSLVTSRTFTNRTAAPAFGTGTYGEHIQTDGNSFSWSGVTFSAALPYATFATGATVIGVFNSVGSSSTPWGHDTSDKFYSFSVNASGKVVMRRGYAKDNISSSPAGATVNNNAAHMVAMTRVAGNGPQTALCYVDGSLSDTSSDGAFGTSAALINSIGGIVGSDGMAVKLVYLLVYNKVLSSTEISDLYATLGLNTFGPVTITSPASMTGTISLDAFTLSGAFATGALSLLTGDIPLDAFALSGFLGLAPGRIDSNPFKNWTGTLLAGITIPRLTFLKLSDMSTVLQLTNQTIGGSGVLTVTNAAFTPGTTYLVVAASVDGASLGAEIYTAT